MTPKKGRIFSSKYTIGRVSRVSSRSVGAAYQAKRGRQQKVTSFFKKLFILFSILGIFGAIGLGGTIFFLAKKLPDVSSLDTYIPIETTKIYSADNVVLAELHEEENRSLIPIEAISPNLKRTVIAMEDTAFYKHKGLNFKAIARALYRDIVAMSFVEGGSTLTQQLARNLFLTKQKKLLRKLEEAILAVQIEKQYTKTEILGMYLNQVYWGHNAYGIESASNLYFGKSSRHLSFAESAMLVGLLKGPELLSPFKNMAAAKRRQRVVLGRMETLGIISKEEAQNAYDEKLVLATRKKLRYKAPYFTSHVLKQVIAMYGEKATYTSGMKIRTTLNYELQKEAEKVTKKYIDKGNQPYWIKDQRVPSLNYNQAAIVALDPRKGHILALQGGNGFLQTQFNRVTQAKRQAGSAFKPFVYLSALKRGFSPGSFIDDAPVTFNTIEGPYAPQNYSLKFRGKIPMRKALERSVNVVAIKLNDMIGPKTVMETAYNLGLKSELQPILSLPLGAAETTMLDLAAVYGVFANSGIRVEPVAILSIEDRNGISLYKHQHQQKEVEDPNMIATLVEMMKGIVNYGTGRNAKLPRPMAGKTGTTSDYKDAWFVGFVPQMVCAAWVGNDDNAPMTNVTGGWMPALMWRDFMKVALRDIKPEEFRRPKGLVNRKVSWASGKLASEASPPDKVTTEKYWRGKEPTEKETFQDVQSATLTPTKPGANTQLLDILDF